MAPSACSPNQTEAYFKAIGAHMLNPFSKRGWIWRALAFVPGWTNATTHQHLPILLVDAEKLHLVQVKGPTPESLDNTVQRLRSWTIPWVCTTVSRIKVQRKSDIDHDDRAHLISNCPATAQFLMTVDRVEARGYDQPVSVSLCHKESKLSDQTVTLSRVKTT